MVPKAPQGPPERVCRGALSSIHMHMDMHIHMHMHMHMHVHVHMHMHMHTHTHMHMLMHMHIHMFPPYFSTGLWDPDWSTLGSTRASHLIW